MPISKLRPAFTFTEDRLRELQAVVPEAFADGRINWDTLKEALGETLEDEAQEHFGLFWPGKREARRLAAMPSKGTLIPQPGAGVDEDNTHNLFIEGDNLEVLKLLQKSYAGRVKMIYIDPPYNTGNDFVYPDDYSEPLENYLERTGQVDESGQLLTTNSRASGRFHSNWLNMIFPRLVLAKRLLRDDGIIFVSIDDNEIYNLRQVMNEIFGEENFIEQVVWKNKYGAGAMTRGFISVHEYILCYSKNPIENIQTPLDDDSIKQYDKKDNKFASRGGYVTQPLATTSMDNRPNLRYPIKYNGEEIWPEKQWIWARERMEEALKNDEVVIKKGESGSFSVRFKQYLKDENGIMRKGKPISVMNGPFNQDGTKEVTDLLGKGVFDFPKPSELIKYLASSVINGIDDKNGIYLDFFAGSATTAHAIFKLNQEDGGNRKFILVQLPEPIKNSAYSNIAEIGKERIRRTIKKLKKEKQGEFDFSPIKNFGFKCYKLLNSHFSEWQQYSERDVSQLEMLFTNSETPLVKGWQPENLVAEILLLQGFPLDSKVNSLPEFKVNEVQQVTSEFVGHHLYVCLDKKVKAETVAKINLRPEDILVCLDSALSDEAKVKLADQCNLKVI